MARAILCPYCGLTEAPGAERCGSCGGFFDDLSRRVTQQHMGPWFVRDPQHPFRPGCSYETLTKQIQRGKVGPDTVLRGPTTRQFWVHARQAPGIAHLVGYCHACGFNVPKNARQCPRCAIAFTEPSDRDMLGLAPLDPAIWDEVEKARAAEAATTAQNPAPRPAAAPGVTHTAARSGARLEGSAGRKAPGAAGITLLPEDPPRSQPQPAPPRPVPPPQPAPARPVAAAPPVQPPPAPASPLAGSPKDSVPWMTADPVAALAAEGPEPTRGSGSTSVLIWALVALNAILLIAVVGFLVIRNHAPASAEPSPATPPAVKQHTTPTAPAQTPAPVQQTPAPAPAPPPAPTPAAPAPAPAATRPVTPPTPPAPSTPATPPPAPKLTVPTTGPGSGRVSFFGISAAEGRPSVTPEQLAALNAQVNKASDLMKADKPAEALAVLQQLKAHMPQGVDAHELDGLIAQVQAAVERKKLSAFFGQE